MLSPLLQEAIAALASHAVHVLHRDRLALVDFSLHSRELRFHLVDIAGGRFERSWLVAHGSGSDPRATGALQSFSNRPGSNATSCGAYLTANRSVGKHGQSQRLIGRLAQYGFLFLAALSAAYLLADFTGASFAPEQQAVDAMQAAPTD